MRGDPPPALPPGAAAGAVAGALASEGSALGEVLGRALDPPVCCQLRDACRDRPEITPDEARSRCIAENGQPLSHQYCHTDGMCRP